MLLSRQGRPRPAPLLLALAAYLAGGALACLLAVEAARQLGTVVLAGLAPSPPGRAAAPAHPAGAPEPPARGPAEGGEASPAPLTHSGLALWSPFGTSSRGAWRRPSRPAEDADELPSGATYRTVCVRLCDGYYFPISFAATEDRFDHDSEVCRSRCGAQGRLFVHRNPGGAVESMQDLSGRLYSRLPTAFLYRTRYVASCTCQPHPWEAAAQDRHRVYALAAALRRGDRDAAKGLQTLQAKARLAGAPLPPAPRPAVRPGSPAPAEVAARDTGGIMRLGGEADPAAEPASRPRRSPMAPRAPRDHDWVRRAFDASGGR